MTVRHPGLLLIAFEAVAIGVLGDHWGTLAGGIFTGVAQKIGARIDAARQSPAGHIVFPVIAVFRSSRPIFQNWKGERAILAN